MPTDTRKTKSQLIDELDTLRARLAELEDAASPAGELGPARVEHDLARFSVEHSSDALFWIDPSGRFTYVNEAACRSLGYTREELLRMSVPEIDAEITAEAWPRHWAELSSHGSATLESHHRTKDGRLIPVEIVANHLHFEGREYNLAFARDISERQRAEQALRESERLLRSVIDNAPIILWAVDAEGRFTFSEGRGLKSLGLLPGEAVGQSLFELYADNHEIIAAVRSALAGTEVRAVAVVQDMSWETRYGPLTDDAGQILGAMGVSIDITERKRAEQERIRLSTAVEQAAEAVLLTDTRGSIQYVNPAFETLSGFTREDALGRTPEILKSGAHDETFFIDLWSTIRKGRVWNGRITNRQKSGVLVEHEATISPIHDSEGAIIGYVWIARDVTDQVQLETLLRQSQKMEAVGQLAGGVAHDFNNILQAIRGYTELALDQSSGDSSVRNHLEQVRQATDRAASLVRQLLAFSRRERLKPECLDLDEVILGTLKMLGRVLGEHIDLDLRPRGGSKLINADRGQIEQILMNLCVNARDAMPEGGTITVATDEVAFDEEFVEQHPWATVGCFAVLSVSDRGRGIPDEIREHIFEPFFTTKDVGQGTGLGLATVYAITKRHEGLIDVTSEPDGGTTFRIHLPVARGGTAADAVAAAQPWPVGGNETILLAEDDRMVREWVLRVLGAAGYRVLVASDGDEALDLFLRDKDNVDLALLDVLMPRRSGREVSRTIRAHRPEIPVVFTTGYSDDVLTSEQQQAGPLQILQKPYDAREILLKIREVLDGTK
jgi:PAS domain S-box-containing protein